MKQVGRVVLSLAALAVALGALAGLAVAKPARDPKGAAKGGLWRAHRSAVGPGGGGVGHSTTKGGGT